MYTRDSFPQGHRPYLHTTFNCTLSKTIARSTTKAVPPINCVSFHRKHRFPSRSLSTNVRHSSIQVTLCLLFRTTTAQSHHGIKVSASAPPPPRGPGGWRGRRSPHHRRRHRRAQRATARASTRHPCGPEPTGVRLLAPWGDVLGANLEGVVGRLCRCCRDAPLLASVPLRGPGSTGVRPFERNSVVGWVKEGEEKGGVAWTCRVYMPGTGNQSIYQTIELLNY